MRAVVYTEFGSPDVLRLEEIPKPIPSDDDVLVEIHAASVNYGDWAALVGSPFLVRLMNGPLRPRNQILGDDIAGRVEAVGTNVKQFRPGDEVFGFSHFGAFAEYRCVPEHYLAPKSASISFEEAAAIPIAATTALQGLRDKGRIQSGKKVLINGASGGVGTFAVQIAKSYDAEVTGVCSANKVDMVRSIGADHVIDYSKQDFTRSEQRYDLILAVGGYHPISAYRSALSHDGILICTGGSMAQYFQALLLGPLISLMGSRKMGVVFPMPKQEDLIFLTERYEAGKIIPVIDGRYTLSEVSEALRYFGEGHTRGKIVITMERTNKT